MAGHRPMEDSGLVRRDGRALDRRHRCHVVPRGVRGSLHELGGVLPTGRGHLRHGLPRRALA
ncbi:hypothetical protein [Micromonospora parastrephiae]|uniref:hypothetical protein n=1 Tax=Micromonospora parastrephiae TaxID=2806101 RepID=UPI003898D5BC